MPNGKVPTQPQKLIPTETRNNSPKRGKDYLILNVEETFSGEAAPGKTFIYVFLSKQDMTGKNLHTPFYVGKTKNTKKRFANHSIKNRYIKTHLTEKLNIYIAGTIINDFALAAEKDLIQRLADNSFQLENPTIVTETTKRITKKLPQIVDEWQHHWNKLTENQPRTELSYDSITKDDVIRYLETKKFSSALASIISTRLVQAYDAKTETSSIVLKSSDIQKDIKAVNKAIKSLRYWVTEKPINFNTPTVFRLNADTQKTLVDIKIGTKVLATTHPKDSGKVASTPHIKVQPYRKKQTPKTVAAPAVKGNIRHRMDSVLLQNPAVSNIEYNVVSKIVKQYNPDTGKAILPLSTKDLNIFESSDLNNYFLLDKKSTPQRAIFKITELFKNQL